jgi:SpoVK/Ycf46/Vps4 family AAA+-type ATPase
MMTVMPDLFNQQLPLPNSALSAQEPTLVGFEQRYVRLRQRLWLIRHPDDLEEWSNRHYRRVATICGLVARQHPFLIFAGDSGTGKTATATCLANRLAREEAITDAFATVTKGAGKSRTAVLIIDEGDSLAASRTREQSHHEDKVAVNTLIQLVDQARDARGRIVIILCTNRLAALDPAVVRVRQPRSILFR